MYIQRWGIFLYHMWTKKMVQTWTAQKWNQWKPDIANTGKQHDAEYNMKYKHGQQRWQSGHGKYIRLYNKLKGNLTRERADQAVEVDLLELALWTSFGYNYGTQLSPKC
jgi:hypothetical protein